MGPARSPRPDRKRLRHSPHQNRRPVPFASIITCRNNDEKRHFTVKDGKAEECEEYRQAGSDIFFEKPPTKQIHLFCVHWGGSESDYRPRSAANLSKTRERRQERAVEREAEAAPLFANLIRDEGFVKRITRGK